MEYPIEEAKELVVRAGKMLVQSGLTARTWGNISARISDEKFVITPSGLAYEDLAPEQIVVVNIADCSYEGNIKPSSEKGIHADTYRMRPDVNFVIHTHQVMASVLSIEGKDIYVHDKYKNVLGDVVPCAAYAMPSTGKLRKNIAEVVCAYPDSKAILMKNHGTICVGKDLDNSFEIAQALESMSKEIYDKACVKSKKRVGQIPDYGRSSRRGSTFILELRGNTYEYVTGGLPDDVQEEAVLHSEIYKSCNTAYVIHTTDEEVVEVSSKGKILRPLLDDLAQMVGVNIRTVKDGSSNPKVAAKELKSKNAVLLENEGAVCTGDNESDAEAAAMILRKGCAAALYAEALNRTDRLSTADAYIQRFIYKKKYSKMKEQRG